MPSDSLSRSRLDSFSDGVIAVIITIMVLELKVPSPRDMATAEVLRQNLRIGAVYLLSFVNVGIYWVNHHYLLDDVEHVTHRVLWANLAFLFSLSLIPFGTEWIAMRGIAPVPVAMYAACFNVPSLAWAVLAAVVGRHTGIEPAAGKAKRLISAVLNVASIGVAFLSPWGALAMIAFVAGWWLLPPPRVAEKMYGSRLTPPARTR